MDAKKVMTEVVEFVDVANELVKELTEKNAELEKQIGSKVEKQAAEETQPVLNKEKLEATVSGLIGAGIAKESEREEILKQATADPNVVLSFLDRIAVSTKQARALPVMGKVAGNVAPGNQRESDRFYESKF